MKKIILTTILAFILLVFSGILITQAVAETKTVKSTTTNYITKMEFIPVFDVKGHIIGMFERRGVSVYETGEVAAYLNWGTFDLTNHQGPVQGVFPVNL